MPGPDPKTNRRRRNTPAKIAGRVHLDPAGRKGPVPKPRARLVNQAVKEMWREWWRSPQATQWHTQTSVMPLTRLAMLYDQMLAGVSLSSSDATAMRQLEDRFGLTPKGLKDLNWSIGDAGDGDAKPEPSGNVTSIGKYREMVGG